MNTKPNPSASEKSNPERATLKRRKGGCRKLFLLGLILSVTVAGWSYWLWKSKPVYWGQQQQFLEKHTPRERLIIAESVEKRILDKLNFNATTSRSSTQNQTNTLIDTTSTDTNSSSTYSQSIPGKQTKALSDDPNAPRQIFLTVEEINAWIDQRLGDWASNRGLSIPDFVNDPMIAIEDENLILAFHFNKPPINQVISVVTSIELIDGEAVLAVEGVRGGRLNVPGVKTASQAIGAGAGESELAEVSQKIVDAFDGKSFDPVVKLNRQKLELIDFELEEDGARLTIKPVTKKK